MYCIKPNNGSLTCNNYSLRSFISKEELISLPIVTIKEWECSDADASILFFLDELKYFFCAKKCLILFSSRHFNR